MFSYFEIFLPGRHLHLRSFGSIPFSSPFPSFLKQLEPSFSSRMAKHCKSNHEFLHLLKDKQGIAIHAGISRQITAWASDIESISAAKKQRPSLMDTKSIADINQKHRIGEGIGKNDTHR